MAQVRQGNQAECCKQGLYTGNLEQTIQGEDPAVSSAVGWLQFSISTSEPCLRSFMFTAQTARPHLSWCLFFWRLVSQSSQGTDGWMDVWPNWASSLWQDSVLKDDLHTHGEEAYTWVTGEWSKAGGNCTPTAILAVQVWKRKLYLFFPNLPTLKVAESLIR